MIKAELVIDITDTKGDVREALEDFAVYSEVPKYGYQYLDKSDIRDFIENDFSGEENLLEGWNVVLKELDKENVEGFMLLYSW